MKEYHYLSKLIENLLFLARSDHGQLKLQKEMININKEILTICDYYQAIACENKIELICSGNANLFVDLTLFKRVISNLIANSLNNTLPNGKIKINIESLDQSVNISISDTGIGIANEHIPRLCDRFYRIDVSRCSQSGGLGLGLAIVKSIVNLHKGTLNIKSKLHLGTTVDIQLPSF